MRRFIVEVEVEAPDDLSGETLIKMSSDIANAAHTVAVQVGATVPRWNLRGSSRRGPWGYRRRDEPLPPHRQIPGVPDDITRYFEDEGII